MRTGGSHRASGAHLDCFRLYFVRGLRLTQSVTSLGLLLREDNDGRLFLRVGGACLLIVVDLEVVRSGGNLVAVWDPFANNEVFDTGLNNSAKAGDAGGKHRGFNDLPDWGLAGDVHALTTGLCLETGENTVGGTGIGVAKKLLATGDLC